jgi:non-canonical purine NTP pyrophosphatase (RdgB/HAM1 family)
VDDVGLFLTVLNGLPGPFVKFFVEAGTEKICRLLDGFDDRSAVGKAGIGYYDEDGFQYFEGKICGTIATHPRGEGGFGWDAIFEAEGYDGRTRAELTQSEYDEVYRQIRPIEELKRFLKQNTRE